jgi:hypothetical protein
MVADAVFADVRTRGEKGKHIRFTVESKGARARAVAFGVGGRLAVDEGVPALATFALEVNEWNGVSEPRLVLRRAQPAPAPIVARALEPEAPVELATARAPASGEPQELVLFAVP